MKHDPRPSWRQPRFWLLPVVMAAGVAAVIWLGSGPQPQFVRYPEAEAAAVRNPHAYQGKPLCQRCHPRNDRRVDGDPSALCTGCHRFEHRSHPLGVTMPAATRIALPLGRGGVVQCHTCHDPHDLARQPKGLRVPARELCKVCHQNH